jgi:hypothetical protein
VRVAVQLTEPSFENTTGRGIERSPAVLATFALAAYMGAVAEVEVADLQAGELGEP